MTGSDGVSTNHSLKNLKAMAEKNMPIIMLTVDVEDWFQVENFKGSIAFDSWDQRQLRVERNTHLILDLLDSSTAFLRTPSNPRATFFILGWLAERLPGLVREIANRGHEVASHGHDHHLCSCLSPKQLIEDLTKSKEHLSSVRLGPCM